jgi:hypothetical protein
MELRINRRKLENGRQGRWVSVIDPAAVPGVFDEFIKRSESIKHPFMVKAKFL